MACQATFSILKFLILSICLKLAFSLHLHAAQKRSSAFDTSQLGALPVEKKKESPPPNYPFPPNSENILNYLIENNPSVNFAFTGGNKKFKDPKNATAEPTLLVDEVTSPKPVKNEVEEDKIEVGIIQRIKEFLFKARNNKTRSMEILAQNDDGQESLEFEPDDIKLDRAADETSFFQTAYDRFISILSLKPNESVEDRSMEERFFNNLDEKVIPERVLIGGRLEKANKNLEEKNIPDHYLQKIQVRSSDDTVEEEIEDIQDPVAQENHSSTLDWQDNAHSTTEEIKQPETTSKRPTTKKSTTKRYNGIPEGFDLLDSTTEEIKQPETTSKRSTTKKSTTKRYNGIPEGFEPLVLPSQQTKRTRRPRPTRRRGSRRPIGSLLRPKPSGTARDPSADPFDDTDYIDTESDEPTIVKIGILKGGCEVGKSLLVVVKNRQKIRIDIDTEDDSSALHDVDDQRLENEVHGPYPVSVSDPASAIFKPLQDIANGLTTASPTRRTRRTRPTRRPTKQNASEDYRKSGKEGASTVETTSEMQKETTIV